MISRVGWWLWRRRWRLLAMSGVLVLLVIWFVPAHYRFSFAEMGEETSPTSSQTTINFSATNFSRSPVPSLVLPEQGDQVSINIPPFFSDNDNVRVSIYRRSTSRGFTRINEQSLGVREYKDYLPQEEQGEIAYFILWLDREGKVLLKSDIATLIRQSLATTSL